MLRLLLVCAWAAAAPPRIPQLEVDGPKSDVQTADNSLFQGIDALLSTPVEPARVPRLKDQADEVAASGGSLAGASRELLSRLYRPTDFASEFGPNADERFSDAWTTQQRLAKRQADARSRLRRLREMTRRPPDSLLDEIETLVSSAEAAQPGAEGPLKTADEERSSIRDSVRHCRDRRGEVERAVENLDRSVSPLNGAAQTLKTRLDALGDPPDPERKTRVYGALDELLNPARQAHGGAAPLLSLLSQYRSDYERFSRSATRFNDGLAAASSKQEEAASKTFSAESRLSEAERY